MVVKTAWWRLQINKAFWHYLWAPNTGPIFTKLKTGPHSFLIATSEYFVGHMLFCMLPCLLHMIGCVFYTLVCIQQWEELTSSGNGLGQVISFSAQPFSQDCCWLNEVEIVSALHMKMLLLSNNKQRTNNTGHALPMSLDAECALQIW